MTSIREIHTAAAAYFDVEPLTIDQMEAVTGWHELGREGNVRPTLDSMLDDDAAQLVTRWAVDRAAHRAGVDTGNRGRMGRAEARAAGATDRTIWDEQARSAYSATIAAAITAISTDH